MVLVLLATDLSDRFACDVPCVIQVTDDLALSKSLTGMHRCAVWYEIWFGAYLLGLDTGNPVFGEPAHQRSQIRAFIIRLLESIISKYGTSEISIF